MYADDKAIGVVEAQSEEHTLRRVETQSGKYKDGLPANVPHYHLPLPFAPHADAASTGLSLDVIWSS